MLYFSPFPSHGTKTIPKPEILANWPIQFDTCNDARAIACSQTCEAQADDGPAHGLLLQASVLGALDLWVEISLDHFYPKLCLGHPTPWHGLV